MILNKVRSVYGLMEQEQASLSICSKPNDNWHSS